MSEENKNNNDEHKFEGLTEEAKKLAERAAEVFEEEFKEAKGVIDDALEAINFEDKYKEALASMENLRKRLDTERQDLLKYKASSFIQAILPTIDMFELAMNANNVSEEVKNWLVGFEMILKNFKTTLEAEGVVEIVVNRGDDFDGKIHHAIENREDEEVEDGHIIEVKQKGYKLHDRLLRPAAVVVSKKSDNSEEED